MKLIEFLDINRKSIWLNPDHVIAVWQHGPETVRITPVSGMGFIELRDQLPRVIDELLKEES